MLVQRRQPVRRSLPLLVATAVLALIGLAGLVGATVQAGHGGYLPGSTQRFTTDSPALVTREVFVAAHSARPGDPDDTARIRLSVTPAIGSRPVFVGIARTADVERYLRGTAHDEFAGASYPPFRARFDRRPGAAVADPPGQQQFWVRTSSGTGSRVIEWTKPHGAWTLVVMNADGGPGLDVTAGLGFRLPFVAVGAAALAVAALLGWFLFRRRERIDRPDSVTPAATEDRPEARTAPQL